MENVTVASNGLRPTKISSISARFKSSLLSLNGRSLYQSVEV